MMDALRDNEEWEEWIWRDGGIAEEKIPADIPLMEEPETDFDRERADEILKTLAEISGKTPQNSDDVYDEYSHMPNHKKKVVRLAACRLVKKIGGSFNFDDALVWLATFGYNVLEMNKAISEWMKK